MKKLFTILTLASVCFLSQKANAQAFEKGNKIINLGLQLQSSVSPITISGEYGLTDDIGAGAKISYGSASSVSSFFIGGMANYHLSKVLSLGVDKLDIYAGPTAGLYRTGVSILGISASSTDFAVLGQAGARYYITDAIGVHGQLNLGIVNTSGSNLEVGVSFKLK